MLRSHPKTRSVGPNAFGFERQQASMVPAAIPGQTGTAREVEDLR